MGPVRFHGIRKDRKVENGIRKAADSIRSSLAGDNADGRAEYSGLGEMGARDCS